MIMFLIYQIKTQSNDDKTISNKFKYPKTKKRTYNEIETRDEFENTR